MVQRSSRGVRSAPEGRERAFRRGVYCTGKLNATRKHKCLLCSPFYGRACRLAMSGEFKPAGLKDVRGQQPRLLLHTWL